MCLNEFGGLIIYYHMHNQYFSALGTFSGSGRGSAAHLFAGGFHRQHILGTLWVLNFDVHLCLEIDGVILTFLPCNVPSNLSLHKDLPHFPGHLSAIYSSGMSTPVINRLCRNMLKPI